MITSSTSNINVQSHSPSTTHAHSGSVITSNTSNIGHAETSQNNLQGGHALESVCNQEVLSHVQNLGGGHSHGQDIADATPPHLLLPPSEHVAKPGIDYGHGQDIAVSTPPQGTMLANSSPLPGKETIEIRVIFTGL